MIIQMIQKQGKKGENVSSMYNLSCSMELETALLERSGHALQAPMNGDMVRTIHESTACRAFYRFCKEGHTLFEIETQMASFEYEFPE